MNYERKSQEHKFPKTARGEKSRAKTENEKSGDVQKTDITVPEAETEKVELIGRSKKAERRARKKQFRRETD
eukprot:6280984-Karenia_brevis.AAC.1